MYKSRLKKLREQNNITQEELAKIIEISRGSYGHYENEDDIITLKNLNQICNYFNISFDYIFGFTNDKNYDTSFFILDKNKVGKRIKEFRNSQKLTQVKLATILNTVHPVITNYENGKHIISTSFLYDICKKYGVSADYLLGRIDYIPAWCKK